MIFVNFKTYAQTTGESSVEIAKKLIEVSHKYSVPVVPVVQAADISEVKKELGKASVWAQHIDPIEAGAHTGYTLAESVVADGAEGTFLNHSEHKFDDFKELKKAVIRAREVELQILIFASDLEELEKVLELKPDYVSYEPPELIGSETTSVAKEEPEIIKKAVEIAERVKIPLIVGAGIKSTEDIEKSLEFGASGFAIASGIVKDDHPAQALADLLEGYKK